MELKDIKSAISKATGIGELNPMQVAVALTSSHKVVLLSPTGSGKTLAYATWLLRRIAPKECGAGALLCVIVAPSRELVRQICDVVRPVAAMFGIKTLAMYGGNSFAAEASSVTGEMPGIIVATPGRLLDHIDRGSIDVSRVRRIVFDEYDKTLELGFHEQMRKIARRLGNKLSKNTALSVMVTSATALAEVPDFVDLSHAEIINFTSTDARNERLRIVEAKSPTRDKLATLAALIRQCSAEGPIMVFVNHRESADRVGEYLRSQDISCAVYHGGFDQQHREMALARFDSRAAKVLVATDLAGRGIDVENVATIIHYHSAPDKDVWTHRNGRTARGSSTRGTVYVITGPDEYAPDFAEIEHEFYPDLSLDTPVKAEKTLIYINRGKRDKISRGDILGYIVKQAGIPGDAVGKITIGLSYALVAVNNDYADAVIAASKAAKLKNQRFVASRVD